tara:strand:- start:357 stop:731 length:375 start_codon:yes stop_codon:yes gene_type:complete
MAFSLVQNFWQKGLQRSSSGSGAQEAENDELQGLKKRVAQLAEVTEATKSKRQKLEEEHEHSIAQMKKTQQEYDAMADRCDEKDAKKAVLLDKWQALPEARPPLCPQALPRNPVGELTPCRCRD